MESNQLAAMSKLEAKRGRDASRERRRSSSPIILHESPVRRPPDPVTVDEASENERPATKKSRDAQRWRTAGRDTTVEDEVTQNPTTRALSLSTPTIERDVSTFSPFTELESVTARTFQSSTLWRLQLIKVSQKRKQEVERQLEMIMALTNESRQLARRQEELTRVASRSSGV
ncbi:MAG: hypothetical protein Q9228_002151 [Teloschistes exilis]